MADISAWIGAVRASHDRFVGLVQPLSDDAVEGPSYAEDWSIAQTASHLGSQAEIFGLALDAGLSGAAAPGPEAFGPIWERWNALGPVQQVRESVTANEELVSRVERTSSEERGAFTLFIFHAERNLSGLLSLRLGEHALHTWDIAVALDSSATVSADAVELLVDELAPTVGRAGKPAPGTTPVPIRTTAPDRAFVLTLDPQVALEPADSTADDALVLPAEAFLRLVYGRLDVDHTPSGLSDARLETLRTVFPGF